MPKQVDKITENIAHDISVFGEALTKQCILITFWQRIWGAWQVLIGEAGIIFLRVKHKDFYENPKHTK